MSKSNKNAPVPHSKPRLDETPPVVSDQILPSDWLLFGDGHSMLSRRLMKPTPPKAWRPAHSCFVTQHYFMWYKYFNFEFISSLKKNRSVSEDCLNQGKQPRNPVVSNYVECPGIVRVCHLTVAALPVRVWLQIFMLWQAFYQKSERECYQNKRVKNFLNRWRHLNWLCPLKVFEWKAL